jgi:two-component system OmpR family sensor kinase
MFSSWPLRKRLIALTAAITALAGVAIGVATLVGIRSYMVGQLDEELVQAVGRVHNPDRDRDGDIGYQLNGPGTTVGTVIVAFNAHGDISAAYLNTDATSRRFTPQQLASVPTNGWAREIRTVHIDGGGDYRMAAIGTQNDMTLLMGLPTAAIDRTLSRIATFQLVLILIIIGVVVFAGRKGVTVALRPLERMRETAQRISGMQLSSGEVALTERVQVDDPATEVGQLSQSFNHMLDNIDEALTARRASEAKVRQFVADASHELRTPLTAIRGYSELTRRHNMDVSEDVRHALSRIESESVRMTELVEDLLLLARLDEGRGLELRPLDVSALVKDAVKDAQVAGPDHTWTVKAARGLKVAADKHRLHQVISNLLANARTHTPAGTAVNVMATAADSTVTIVVADNGPGIPADIQATLFERFVRADTSRQRATGSTGLGLAIVDGLVRAHKGTITVESEPGNTRFVITLPRAS